jgi:hypothetical protein
MKKFIPVIIILGIGVCCLFAYAKHEREAFDKGYALWELKYEKNDSVAFVKSYASADRSARRAFRDIEKDLHEEKEAVKAEQALVMAEIEKARKAWNRR